MGNTTIGLDYKQTISLENYKVFLPTHAGGYQIGDENGSVTFNIGKKPNFIHRFFTRVLLGWKWIDS